MDGKQIAEIHLFSIGFIKKLNDPGTFFVGSSKSNDSQLVLVRNWMDSDPAVAGSPKSRCFELETDLLNRDCDEK